MKNRFKVSLLVFLIVILGCFTSVFADTTKDGAEIGTANLNNTTENSAKVGYRLSNPEKGWKRYDDRDSRINYLGSWISNYHTADYLASLGFYNSTGMCAGSMQDSLKFIVSSNKIRILTYCYTDQSGYWIKIDGKTIGNFACNYVSSNMAGGNGDVISYENSNLGSGYHTVELGIQSKSYFNATNDSLWIDSIDIDDSGYLFGISLNKKNYSMLVGQTDNITATVTPDNVTNKAVTWTSSDTSVATVDSNGKVTALKKGTATITATTQDGSNLSSSCTVNVTEPTTISLDKTNDSINVGQTDNITATVNPSNVGVTWISSDNSIITVDSSGKITGLKEGQAIITATTTDGKTATCTVNVIAQQVTKVKLTLYMNDSTTRKFDLTQDEFNDFMNWYTNMSEEVKGTIPYYIFSISAQGSTPAQKHCVPFAKIESFEFE
ncbi:Ig-like domain-containing protein [Clostridium felsineum]|uniref:Ig-like domain-containing protein n=1 Tax=Clostridium felsineum TaxID=36839 RepID=UPI0009D1068A|nr:Ig domain-containing protein [Clostridium felsineum]URZ15490.1 hypothetical protein CLFE_015300 [Clostridium felsineum DSM 794]